MDVRQVFIEAKATNEDESKYYRFCPKCGEQLKMAEEQGIIRPTCSRCGFIQYRNPSPGVVVIIQKDNKILLGKRCATSFKPGSWCLPGGFIEFGESFLEAAHREVKEETGLNIEIRSIVNVVSNFLNAELHTLVIVLLADTISDTLEPGDDIEELGWFSPQEKLPVMAFESDVYIIKQLTTQRVPGLPIDPKGKFKGTGGIKNEN